MKPTHIIAAALSLVLVAGITAFPTQSQAFLTTMGWNTVDPEAYYKVDSKGYDFRVYEWKTQGGSNSTCVAVFSEAGPVGLDCF